MNSMVEQLWIGIEREEQPFDRFATNMRQRETGKTGKEYYYDWKRYGN